MSYSPLPTDQLTSRDEAKELLLSDDLESDALSPNLKSPILKDSWTSSIANWTIYAALIAILATIVNLSLLSGEVYRTNLTPPLPTRRPSTYIGLDQITRNASSLRWPLRRRGFPEYFGLVDSRNPSAQSPNSQDILIDSSHNAIIRFFAHDYGLEHCAIGSYFPGKERLGDKSFTSEGQTHTMQVWLLKEQKEKWSTLKPQPYSWSNKPSRKRLLGKLDTSLANDTTPSFPCPSGSSITIEVECGGADCRLEFVQERPGTRLGFWMVQSEAEIDTA